MKTESIESLRAILIHRQIAEEDSNRIENRFSRKACSKLEILYLQKVF